MVSPSLFTTYPISVSRLHASVFLRRFFLLFFSLTMADVNNCLDAMAQANVEKKRDIMKKEIHKLIRNTSALEQVCQDPRQ